MLSLACASLTSDPQGVLSQPFWTSASAGMNPVATHRGPQAVPRPPRPGQLPFPGLPPDATSPGLAVIRTGYLEFEGQH